MSGLSGIWVVSDGNADLTASLVTLAQQLAAPQWRAGAGVAVGQPRCRTGQPVGGLGQCGTGGGATGHFCLGRPVSAKIGPHGWRPS
jgi:hypothetical protein